MASKVAKCKCGQSYDAEGWRQLQRRGIQHIGDGGDCLELRDCICRSTLGVWIPCGCTDPSPAGIRSPVKDGVGSVQD